MSKAPVQNIGTCCPSEAGLAFDLAAAHADTEKGRPGRPSGREAWRVPTRCRDPGRRAARFTICLSGGSATSIDGFQRALSIMPAAWTAAPYSQPATDCRLSLKGSSEAAATSAAAAALAAYHQRAGGLR